MQFTFEAGKVVEGYRGGVYGDPTAAAMYRDMSPEKIWQAANKEHPREPIIPAKNAQGVGAAAINFAQVVGDRTTPISTPGNVLGSLPAA